jgi:protein-tyrosine kinase
MSRIHEALKRAERERGQADPPVSRVQISAFDPIPEEGEVPSSFAPLTLESLQARSSKLTWNPDPRAQLTEQLDGDLLGAEEFRSLRSFLYLARQQRRLQRILISSPLPREGKSFTALNLAHAIARQPEHGALLIDSDLRLPRLHAALGTTSTPGLSEYLSSEADEFSILQRGPIENLLFIPAGKSPSDPSELIGNGRLKLLLDRLTPAVDWIILDSPPVLPVSDAKLLAELCDAVLLVVQAGSTPYDLARKACQQFRDKQVLAVVLNRAAPNLAYSSYYPYNREDGRNHNGTG